MAESDSKSQEKKEQTIASLGEFGLIDHLTKGFAINNKSTIKAIGDDAAVLKSGNMLSLISTDLLLEGIHFNLMYVPLKHLGYKSVIVNISDIAAMNGVAEQITVSVAISNKISLKAIEEFYEGVLLACKKYNVDLVGGDTSTSLTGFAVSITAIGRINRDKVVYRSGAKNKDLLCVSGDLGAAYLGLQILERERKVYEVDPYTQPKLAGYDYVLERQLKPEARFDIIEKLKNKGIVPTSMIDISDGLSSEALHLCKESNVGCKIYEDRIPVNILSQRVCEELNLDPSLPALNGGEDYELLFTVDINDYDKIKEIDDISLIGYICDLDQGADLIARNGVEVPLEAQGWNHTNNGEN
ncbi:MAG TPA: thiamine-phosphate kinase [Bacteroidales bacterium]|nr:thiamine-phosphate kinase [Bacteroidales bacterium]HXK80628.1 thiamine-phosphate kinase [Bacteroidales bacterium]